MALPPTIIWIAAPTYGLVSVGCRFASTEPSDQEALAPVRAIGPRRSAWRISAGLAPTSSAVPRNPITRPVATRQLRSPVRPGESGGKDPRRPPADEPRGPKNSDTRAGAAPPVEVARAARNDRVEERH